MSAIRKLILTLTAVLACMCSAQAQVWIGGSLNASLTQGAKSFTIAPDVGYCFEDTPFSIACALEYSGELISGESYSHSLTVSPYFHYDICSLEERFGLFVDLAADIEVLDRSFFDVGFTPGVSFMLTEHWSAEFSYGFLGYQRSREPEQAATHEFVFDFKAATGEFSIYYNF